MSRYKHKLDAYARHDAMLVCNDCSASYRKMLWKRRKFDTK